jgi:D-alanyl-D-alanine carboxypeptidase
MTRNGRQLDDRVNTLLDALLANWPIAGGVVAVVTDDELALLRPFGHADLAAGLPVTPGHRFEIGSISKVFTSILVNQLIDEGAFTLDTEVTMLLPWLVLPHGAGGMTVRHLLNHTAGLVSGVDAVPDDFAQAWSLRDTDAAPLASGEFFHYSNLGFILLGLVVTAVTGLPLSDALRRRVLIPAGMADTLPEVTNLDRPSLAIGYTPLRDDAPWLPGQPLVPASWLEVAAGDGNIASTAADMARFLRVLLSRGKLDGAEVISEQSFARITGNLAPDGEDILLRGRHEPVQSSRYGLGLNVEETAAGQLLTHGGGMVGYASFLLADLAHGIGVVVLSNANGDSPIAELVAREVHAEVLGDRGTLTELDPAIWAVRQRKNGMVGRFVSDAGAIELEFTESGELVLSGNGKRGRVFWTLYDRCACEHPDFGLFHLSFESDSSGPAWIYGDRLFRREPAIATGGAEDLAPFEGHYRSHSPWFTNFRVFRRNGRLYLSAAGGVEAPSEDQELVRLAPNRFRIGADERLPERLSFGPVVDGHAIWASRDGCAYSRTFTR